MEQFRFAQRDRILYYTSDDAHLTGKEPWLLVRFENQWFNAIDLRGILENLEYLNPYKDLQLRWLYPQPPQKIFQSRYKETLREVDFEFWTTQIIPNWDNLTANCHCQQEFPQETKCKGHLVSGDLNRLITNPIILDRLQRGPLFVKLQTEISK
jgi:hypothetical protein